MAMSSNARFNVGNKFVLDVFVACRICEIVDIIKTQDGFYYKVSWDDKDESLQIVSEKAIYGNDNWKLVID